MEKLPKGKKVIVGLDPGTTCGIGIIDLNMNLLFSNSIRGANRDTLVRIISDIGEPVLVACDVSQPPDLVKKVASLFNIDLFKPKKDLTSTEKRKIITEYFPSLSKGIDIHILDALAAALKAYLGFKTKFENIEARLHRLLQPDIINNIRSDIIKGIRLTQIISKEISRNENKSKERVVKVYIKDRKKKKNDHNRLIDSDNHVMKLLKWEVKKLRDALKTVTEERDTLENTLKRRLSNDYIKVRKDQLYRIQEKKINDLIQRLKEAENKIEELTSESIERSKVKISERFVSLTRIPTFTYEDVEKAAPKIKKEAAILLVNAAGGGESTAKKLAEIKPRIIIRCTEMSHQAEDIIKKYGIPIIPSHELDIQYLNDIPVIEKTNLEKKIKEYEIKQSNLLISKVIESMKEQEEK